MAIFQREATDLLEPASTLLLRVSAASIFLMMPFLVKNLIEGRFFLCAIATLILAIFAFNLWTITRKGWHYPALNYLILCPVIVTFLVFSLSTQGLIGAFWCYPAVLSFYLLMPKRIAYFANLVLLAVTLPVIVTLIETELALRIVATLLTVSLFTAIFVSVIDKQRSRMRTVNEGLQAEVAERTAAEHRLGEEIACHRETAQDLAFALEAAQEASDAKSRFLSGMTHELRTPLNAILGFGQMLDGAAGTLSDEKRKEYLGYILFSGDRLYGLINQVLDIAAIESGVVTLGIEEVSLRSTVGRVVDELSLLAEEAEVTLHDETINSALPYINADPARTTQALVNLVNNAIKYNTKGGSVRITAIEKPDCIRVSVVDTGLGIAKERHGEVFEIFNRLDAKLSTVEGSGVGLSLTREFIEKMGGAIGFESELGKGSTFWFELPRSDIETEAPISAAS